MEPKKPAEGYKTVACHSCGQDMRGPKIVYPSPEHKLEMHMLTERIKHAKRKDSWLMVIAMAVVAIELLVAATFFRAFSQDQPGMNMLVSLGVSMAILFLMYYCPARILELKVKAMNKRMAEILCHYGVENMYDPYVVEVYPELN